MRPSHVASACHSRHSGIRPGGSVSTAVQRKRARRRPGGTPASSFSNLSRFAWSVAPGPAERAECTPGAPPSASTSRPESSATAANPDQAAYARALRRALSRKVAPVSSTSGGAAVPTSFNPTSSTGTPSRIARSSRSLPGLPVASSSRRCSMLNPPSLRGSSGGLAAAEVEGGWAQRQPAQRRYGRLLEHRAEHPLLLAHELADPGAGQVQQDVQLGAAERLALGGALDLDQAAETGHHHVHVDRCADVLLVGKVKAGDAVDDPHADRGDVVPEREALQPLGLDELVGGGEQGGP